MDFACSRCAHRQAEDASCAGCGNDVVQDLRDRRGRDVLHDAESRWQRRRHARFIAVGAVTSIAVFGVVYALYLVFVPHATGSLESLDLFADRQERNVNLLVGLAGLGAGLAVIAVLEATLGRRRRFPYLDEYDRQKPRSPYR